MGGSLGLGVVLVAAALVLGAWALLSSGAPRVAKARLTGEEPQEASVVASLATTAVAVTDAVLRRRGWRPFSAEELELAGIRSSSSAVVTLVAVVAVGLGLLGGAALSPLLGVVLVVATIVGSKLEVSRRASARRRAFAGQLDESVQMLASALRAGHSLPKALDAVSVEAASPSAEEFARVVNENRLGKDLVVALRDVAKRMRSEDLDWIAQAVMVQRDTGGNLNEVLDQVGDTVRERAELAEHVRALSAEGRVSAYILMGLPFVIGGAIALMNPAYMAPLFTTTIGWLLLAVCVVMMSIGGAWMSAIAKVEV